MIYLQQKMEPNQDIFVCLPKTYIRIFRQIFGTQTAISWLGAWYTNITCTKADWKVMCLQSYLNIYG